MRRTRFSTFFVVGVYVAVVLSLVLYFSNEDWTALDLARANWGWLAVATVVEVANRILFALAWIWLVEETAINQKPRRLPLFSAFATSWLARYLPGSGTWMGVRVLIARDTGVRRGTLAVATVYEAVIQLGMLATLGSIALLASNNSENAWRFGHTVLWAVVISAVVMVQPAVMKRLFGLMNRLRRRMKHPMPQVIQLLRLPRVAGLYAVTSLFSSLGILLVAVSVTPALAGNWIEVILLATLSSVASILAFFAPAGLGVRESALTLGLSPFVGLPEALFIAVLHRVLSVVWDILFLLAVRITRLRER